MIQHSHVAYENLACECDLENLIEKAALLLLNKLSPGFLGKVTIREPEQYLKPHGRNKVFPKTLDFIHSVTRVLKSFLCPPLDWAISVGAT